MSNLGFNFDNSYAKLPEGFYTRLPPTPVTAPNVVIFNHNLASEMGLEVLGTSQEELAEIFSGNSMLDGTEPIAQAYAGHQFGHFTMLGDGRAVVWGEHLTKNGRRLDIQFKGSGRTPYSRGGDGRAALGPMLREYIVSEAMHALNIPTTRSLAVVETGEMVYRETPLTGAILTRVASSHIRVGTFQYAAAVREPNLLHNLINYTVRRHFPEIQKSENIALSLLEQVAEKQIDLIVNWMRVGFIHGVMNTDNMALSGETIDYGPCAFIDHFEQGKVFSSIDRAGRYAYSNQPIIAQWNLARLAEALLPAISSEHENAIKLAKPIIEKLASIYQQKWLTMMRRKLGLLDEKPGDEKLVNGLLELLETTKKDYTNTFIYLTKSVDGKLMENQNQLGDWFFQWQQRLQESSISADEARKIMEENNPLVIPRNHQLEHALNAANEKNFEPFHSLVSAITKPHEQNDAITQFQKPPEESEIVQQTFCGT